LATTDIIGEQLFNMGVEFFSGVELYVYYNRFLLAYEYDAENHENILESDESEHLKFNLWSWW
jgi:hypothetical protein